MNVLVINAGSSSLKFQLLDVDTREVYAKGNCERIGIDNAFVGYESIAVEGKQRIDAELPDHKTAMQYVIDIINATGKDFIGIGHRVVQGGWYFPDSKVVTDESLGWVREVAPLAPLHNYAEADAIQVCRDLFPDKGNVVVADTSFHYNIPEKAWRYALPRDVVDKLHIRKYGAHGTSHRYIWRAAKAFVGEDMHKLVSCHLGSGSSLSAIQDGKDMDTTMGLTPLDGLIMGTRCGTIDPATVCYLVREGGYTIDEGADNGDATCQMPFDMFYYRTSQLVMEMAQAMHGFDTLAFSAGIGENSATMRMGVAKELEWMGVKIDPEKNAIRSGEVRDISAADSKIRVLVVPTNEEYMIALDVAELLG